MIDPRNIDVQTWTDFSEFSLDQFTPPYRLDDPAQWQHWAMNLFGDADLIGQNIPDPFSYRRWQEWAMRFNQVTNLE